MAKIDIEYHKLLNRILVKGERYEDPNRKGVNRIQIPKYTFEHNFDEGFPAITTKKLAWKSVVGETLWILRGQTNIKPLVDAGIPIWNKDSFNFYLKQYRAKDLEEFETLKAFNEVVSEGKLYSGCNGLPSDYKLGDLGKVYGYQLRNFGGKFDQLKWIIDVMINNPRATKKVVTYINPCDKDGQALTPCHTGWEVLVEEMSFNTRNNIANPDSSSISIPPQDWDYFGVPKYQFTLTWNQGSVDTFLGLPFNIASYALLAKILEKVTGMKAKGIVGNLTNVHIYELHLDAVKEQLSKSVDEYDNCELKTLDEFHYMCDKKLSGDLDIDEILNRANESMFKLDGYKSFPRIKVEMLAYNK